MATLPRNTEVYLKPEGGVGNTESSGLYDILTFHDSEFGLFGVRRPDGLLDTYQYFSNLQMTPPYVKGVTVVPEPSGGKLYNFGEVPTWQVALDRKVLAPNSNSMIRDYDTFQLQQPAIFHF